jgi:hypothetical protein
MTRATVIIDSRFVEYGQLLEQRAELGLGRGMGHVIGRVRSATTTYHLQPILSKTHASRVKRTPKGLAAAVSIPDFRAIFFEKGTNRRRRAKVSAKTLARRDTPSGMARQARVANARGVKAVHMLQRALRAGWDDVQREIAEAIRF